MIGIDLTADINVTTVSLQFLTCTAKHTSIYYHDSLFELPMKKVDVLWKRVKKMSGTEGHKSDMMIPQHTQISLYVGVCPQENSEPKLVKKDKLYILCLFLM